MREDQDAWKHHASSCKIASHADSVARAAPTEVRAEDYCFVRRSPQTAPIVFVSQPQREFMQLEGYRPSQEGYPSRRFSQDAWTSSEPALLEQASMQFQARYEEIQLSYPEVFHERLLGRTSTSI